VPAKRRRGSHSAVSFLIACALVVAFAGCSDDATCKSSADCAASQICSLVGQGSPHCLDDCAQDGSCRPGFTCEIVAYADCFACDVVVRACVLAPPPFPKF